MPDAWIRDSFPTISAFLVDEWWDDGKPRSPSTLTVSVGPGGVQVALNDRDGQQSVYTTSSSLEKAMELLEEVLSGGAVPWRRWMKGGKSK